MTKIFFAMYSPETDCVEVSLNDEIHVSFNCEKCNASVRLNEPSDIAYLTRLAREEPGLYVKLAVDIPKNYLILIGAMYSNTVALN